jgi:sugar O-acyltransferase (sialic acid O-acetyltransferase NeuD family)
MADKWLVWGKGGHGRVVADLVRSLGGEVAGFVDAHPEGSNCVSETELLGALSAGTTLPLSASRIALGIGDNAARLAAWRNVDRDASIALVHSQAWISSSARIAAGTVVLPRVVVHTDAVIGEAVILNSGCIVEHDCVIADGAHVSPGAILTGNVAVGECSWIGAGAVVLPGVRIGARCVVGAGAVVTRDVEDAMTVVGNPARPLVTHDDGVRLT